MAKDGTNRGRPAKIIDQKQFEALCQVHATREEVCAVFRVDDMTLNRWCKRTYEGRTFTESQKLFSSQTVVGARRKLIEAWMTKNNLEALKFYLKNYGGMSDKVDHTHAYDQSKPAIVKYVWNAKGDKAETPKQIEEDSDAGFPGAYDEPSS